MLVRDTEVAEKAVISGESGEADSPEDPAAFGCNGPEGSEVLCLSASPDRQKIVLSALSASPR